MQSARQACGMLTRSIALVLVMLATGMAGQAHAQQAHAQMSDGAVTTWRSRTDQGVVDQSGRPQLRAIEDAATPPAPRARDALPDVVPLGGPAPAASRASRPASPDAPGASDRNPLAEPQTVATDESAAAAAAKPKITGGGKKSPRPSSAMRSCGVFGMTNCAGGQN